MSHLIEFDLDGEGKATVLVEAPDIDEPQGQTRVSRGGLVAEKASQVFDAALAGIKPIAQSMLTGLRSAVEDASEIQMEFGVKLSASAGVILANGTTEGHCKVTIKWAKG